MLWTLCPVLTNMKCELSLIFVIQWIQPSVNVALIYIVFMTIVAPEDTIHKLKANNTL